MHRVFVYGTLKRGFPNHEAGMKGQRFLARARTCDAIPLVVTGRWYSPTLISETGIGQRVFGETFDVSDHALAGLDGIEGTHLPLGYDRIRITVESVDDGVVFDAWTYIKDRARIDVIHSGMLDEYHLDPRYVPPSERESD
jgi:gamma-glutamylaminecyclotransferase